MPPRLNNRSSADAVARRGVRRRRRIAGCRRSRAARREFPMPAARRNRAAPAHSAARSAPRQQPGSRPKHPEGVGDAVGTAVSLLFPGNAAEVHGDPRADVPAEGHGTKKVGARSCQNCCRRPPRQRERCRSQDAAREPGRPDRRVSSECSPSIAVNHRRLQRTASDIRSDDGGYSPRRLAHGRASER